MKTEKKCECCGESFASSLFWRKYCSKSCKRSIKRKRSKLLKSYEFKCEKCGSFSTRVKRGNRVHSNLCRPCLREKQIKSASAILRESPVGRALSEKHHKAVEGLFRDPRGVVHYFQNIRKFVNDNKDLFLEEDVKIRGKQSRASGGLTMVHHGGCGSWKGWTLVSDVEIKEGGWDLLRRKQRAVPESNGTAQKVEVV